MWWYVGESESNRNQRQQHGIRREMRRIAGKTKMAGNSVNLMLLCDVLQGRRDLWSQDAMVYRQQHGANAGAALKRIELLRSELLMFPTISQKTLCANPNRTSRSPKLN